MLLQTISVILGLHRFDIQKINEEVLFLYNHIYTQHIFPTFKKKKFGIEVNFSVIEQSLFWYFCLYIIMLYLLHVKLICVCIYLFRIV